MERNQPKPLPQIRPEHLEQVTGSIYFFFQENGVFIPDSLELALQKKLAHDWADVAPLGWLALDKLRGAKIKAVWPRKSA